MQKVSGFCQLESGDRKNVKKTAWRKLSLVLTTMLHFLKQKQDKENSDRVKLNEALSSVPVLLFPSHVVLSVSDGHLGGDKLETASASWVEGFLEGAPLLVQVLRQPKLQLEYGFGCSKVRWQRLSA